MTMNTLSRATDIYGRSLRDLAFQNVLTNLGVTDAPVRVALAETTVGEFADTYSEITAYPVIVIDQGKQRIARLDFYAGSGVEGIEVKAGTEFGMIVDCIQTLHRDIGAELLQAAIHAQTREFEFA